MYPLIKKSILVGIAAVWIIFPTFIFAYNVIYDHDDLINPKYLRTYGEKGATDYYNSVTQKEWNQYKYSGRIVVQYFEYLLVIPVIYISYMPAYFHHYPLESIAIWTAFLAISGLYYIYNYKLNDE